MLFVLIILFPLTIWLLRKLMNRLAEPKQHLSRAEPFATPRLDQSQILAWTALDDHQVSRYLDEAAES
jgi:hypothetical protein